MILEVLDREGFANQPTTPIVETVQPEHVSDNESDDDIKDSAKDSSVIYGNKFDFDRHCLLRCDGESKFNVGISSTVYILSATGA